MRSRCRCGVGAVPSLSQVIRAEQRDMDRRLFARAQTASSLAKALGGRQRSRAYAIKARCLRQLMSQGECQIQADTIRSPGLLSVGLDSVGRLHTHENWLFPGESWWRAT
jgi:hypothetical protein